MIKKLNSNELKPIQFATERADDDDLADVPATWATTVRPSTS